MFMTSQYSRALLKDSKCLILQQDIVKLLGKSTALFLQQLHYWVSSEKKVGKIVNGQKWIYNSSKAWASQLGVVSEPTVRRAISKLKSLNIISVSHFNQCKGDRTNWYTIHYDKLDTLLRKESLNTHSIKMIEPCDQNDHIVYKDTTKITTEIFKQNIPETKHIPFLEKEKTNHPSPNEKKKPNLAQDLLKIWNEEVGKHTTPAEMTKTRASFLVAAYKSKFLSSLERWKEFCKCIASSKFLLGKVKNSFRATIDWSLRFEIIQRILEGDFGCKKYEIGETSLQGNESEIEAEINTAVEPQDVKRFRTDLLKRVGGSTYRAWFKSIEILYVQDEILLKAANKFSADTITSRYGLTLQQLSNRPVRCLAA
jgi:hypothetical protein